MCACCNNYNLKEQRYRGVISASAGNHALALCYHGRNLNIPVVVVMPRIAPMMKGLHHHLVILNRECEQ